ncbi:nad dependent epimerase dehydratase family protein [Fusarium austroafricanum]|uniref:Nad dependent epimerase dehydratase family protein n=1 Tax=Fusarium austroafricanum TaxID=2364996 RepID=A0A8H4KD44_9HYPO|nr:nad dependent epimerase dehydratase family protein [Fusarium austroafricanum]
MITQYQGLKILAHKATREWVQANKPTFSVLTFHPSFVIGPSVLQKQRSEAAPLNDTFYKTLESGNSDVPNGQEIIIMGSEVGWSAIGRAAEELYPDWKVGLKSVSHAKLLPVDRDGFEKILG